MEDFDKFLRPSQKTWTLSEMKLQQNKMPPEKLNKKFFFHVCTTSHWRPLNSSKDITLLGSQQLLKQFANSLRNPVKDNEEPLLSSTYNYLHTPAASCPLLLGIWLKSSKSRKECQKNFDVDLVWTIFETPRSSKTRWELQGKYPKKI